MRTCFIFFCWLATVHCHGQVVLLDKASALLRESKPRNAVQLLNLAKGNVATSGDARTFYLLGFAYKDLFDASTTAVERNTFRDSSLLFFSRCTELDINKSYQQSLSENKNYILGKTFNDAGNYYNAGKYTEALYEYSFYSKFSGVHDRKWLDAHYYKGVCFQQTGMYDSASVYFEFLIRHDYDNETLYIDLSTLYVSQGKETKALEIIETGSKKYPNNYDIKVSLMNLLFQLDHLQELEALADEYLKKDPTNIDVLLLLATACEKLISADNQEAYFTKLESIYKKVLSIDSTEYDANFNLGVLYYNQAVDIVNNTDVETEITLLTKILNQSTTLFENALPYLLKAYDGEQKNINVLTALQAVYYNLNQKEELARINSLIHIASQ